MKTNLHSGLQRLIAIAALSILPALANTAPSPSPVFQASLTTLDEKSTSLATMTGNRPTYVKLWATWCQPCLQQMHHFESTHQQFQESLNVIGVNVWMNESKQAIQRVINKYALSFPIVLDTQGILAKEAGLVGTPLHLLYDQNGKLVHRSHQPSAELDNKISLLASGKLANEESKENNNISEKTDVHSPINIPKKKRSAILFTATFCDWYLKESRPEMASNCSQAQKFVNQLYLQNSTMPIQTIVSRLWTGQNELEEYQEKYTITMPHHIDKRGKVFSEYRINQFPTLVIFEHGKEIGRISNFNDTKSAGSKFTQLWAHSLTKETEG